MRKVASPLKWHGGKGAFQGKLAKWIISLMPDHVHYVEPYAGGLSVLLAKDPEGVSEVVNDIHSELMNFWEIVRHPTYFDHFRDIVLRIPFSEETWKKSADPLAFVSEFGDLYGSLGLSRAVAFFVRCRQSLSGRMKDFATLTRTRTRRGMNEQASAWWSSVEGLQDVHERLKRVVVLNRDALDVIRQQDGPHTLFYLDPPYLHETRATTNDYAHEMTLEQHRNLLELLTTVKGNFLLSGYASNLYRSYEKKYPGWKRHEFSIVNNAAGGKKKREMTECVWTNF